MRIIVVAYLEDNLNMGVVEIFDEPFNYLNLISFLNSPNLKIGDTINSKGMITTRLKSLTIPHSTLLIEKMGDDLLFYYLATDGSKYPSGVELQKVNNFHRALYWSSVIDTSHTLRLFMIIMTICHSVILGEEEKEDENQF